MATNSLNIWSADTTPPAGVLAAINGVPLTAVNTDVRPEDGLFATNHALNTLHYTTATGVKEASTIGTSFASPIPFGLSTDPITGDAVPAFVTIPIGAAPVIFIANAANTGVGHTGNSAVTNIDVNTGTNQAARLFSGTECDATVVGGSSTNAVSAILREPTSGTMNTTEFTSFQVNGGLSQETGVSASANNPLSATCTSTGGSGGGSRFRAIGTGDEVKGVGLTADSLGYLFFSFEAVPPTTIGAANSYKYLTVDGIDPINATYSTGVTPACLTGTITTCQATHSATTREYTNFPNLRNGTYHEWTMYRMIADSTQPTNVANAQALVNAANIVADTSLPDFIPIASACDGTNGLLADEPGWQLYREHYTPSGVVLPTVSPFNPPVGGVEEPNDGPNLFRNANPSGLHCTTTGKTYFSWTLAGTDPSHVNTEVGGDVGGTIVNNAGMQNTSPGATAPGATEPTPH
ncbi:hypothetical protein [Granulicella sp. L60]|uniref:hypothetical protein n=1 Tax=Granulicella sp. L60 TaxID=1641866 RepID=UPI00131B0896|nr:hypothetical protein [Granulicella sp. L60]